MSIQEKDQNRILNYTIEITSLLYRLLCAMPDKYPYIKTLLLTMDIYDKNEESRDNIISKLEGVTPAHKIGIRRIVNDIIELRNLLERNNIDKNEYIRGLLL